MRVGLGNEEEADPVLMIGGDKDTGDVINTTGGQEKFAMSNWLLQFEHRHYFFNDINNSTPFFSKSLWKFISA